VPDAAEHRHAFLAHRLQGKTDEQPHDQRLDDLARGQRRDQRVRDQPEQELGRRLGRTLRLGLSCFGYGGGQVQTGAGLDDVADHEADRERGR
jgi:hypothetical protein